MKMKQDKHYKMGSNKSSSLRSKSRKIQPTTTAGEEKSNGKQQKEQQKQGKVGWSGGGGHVIRYILGGMAF